jgi:hypothetical protein
VRPRGRLCRFGNRESSDRFKLAFKITAEQMQPIVLRLASELSRAADIRKPRRLAGVPEGSYPLAAPAVSSRRK